MLHMIIPQHHLGDLLKIPAAIAVGFMPIHKRAGHGDAILNRITLGNLLRHAS